jgi:alkaline phosphatase D
MNAVRAYFEWMPIRQIDMDDNLRIWRSFSMGTLIDLVMLDTRNYDRSITTLGWNDDYVAEIKDDAGRTLMGSHQENWFYNQLSKSNDRGAVWRIIGNQIIFSNINGSARGESLNADQWDVRRAFPFLFSKITSTRSFCADSSNVGIHSLPQPHP